MSFICTCIATGLFFRIYLDVYINTGKQVNAFINNNKSQNIKYYKVHININKSEISVCFLLTKIFE